MIQLYSGALVPIDYLDIASERGCGHLELSSPEVHMIHVVKIVAETTLAVGAAALASKVARDKIAADEARAEAARLKADAYEERARASEERAWAAEERARAAQMQGRLGGAQA